MNTVYSNKWMSVVETPYNDETYYAVSVPDYVSVVVEQDNKFLMISEYRPIIDRWTLGFPSGMMDNRNEYPRDCANRELFEETGYMASSNDLELIGAMNPDVGRMTNVLWCFYTNYVTGTPKKENGVGIMEFMDIDQINKHIDNKMLTHSLTISCFYMALKHKGKLKNV